MSASLNDAVPVSPMLLTVCVKRNEKSELLMDVFGVSSFVFTTQIEFSEWFVWFQCFAQWCCSFVSNHASCWIKRKVKIELLMPSFFCLHHADWVQWVLCFISMLHSMTLLLGLLSCCLSMWREMKEWFADRFLLRVFFLSSSPARLSSVSVVFDFNDSLSDVVFVYPIYVPIV